MTTTNRKNAEAAGQNQEQGKVRFIFGIHNHQPVGNFDFVFREAFERSYQPFFKVYARHTSIPIAVHFSGPLYDWLEANERGFLDRLADLTSEGRVEILSGGYYEPVLAVIPDHDKAGQIAKMNTYIRTRFHCEPSGLWLTERVWEPHLARNLVESGIKYIALDDYHFLAAGLQRDELTGHYITEEQNASLGVFPIAQSLRYAMPFKEPEEVIQLLRQAGEDANGKRITVVMIDDGEKFGLWPGTYQTCYAKNRWLERFFQAVEANSSWLEMTTFSEEYHSHPPVGRVYLPTVSYFEMSEWALPAQAGIQFGGLVENMKESDQFDALQPFIRGGTWRNFLSRYDESNWMQKRMMHVSGKVHASAGNHNSQPTDAQNHIWQSQCNCAYWHGIFGGLYLPHLRHAVYSELIKAENLVDAVPEGVRIQISDIDRDGIEEVEIATPQLRVFITPRGGAIRELDLIAANFNLVNTMHQYPEAYHQKLMHTEAGNSDSGSIHDNYSSTKSGLAQQLRLDTYLRHSLLDHLLPAKTTLSQFRDELGSGLAPNHMYAVEVNGQTVKLTGELFLNGTQITVEKMITPHGNQLQVDYTLSNRSDASLNGLFAPEFNFSLLGGHTHDRYYEVDGQRLRGGYLDSVGSSKPVRAVTLTSDWEGVQAGLRFETALRYWHYPVQTVSLSEHGFERVYQSSVVHPLYPISLEAGTSINLRITLFAQLKPAGPGGSK